MPDSAPGSTSNSPPQPNPVAPPPSTTGSPTPSTVQPSSSAVTDFKIGDEFGTAKRNLPPIGIVLISIAIIAVVVAFIAFHERAKPQGDGSITFVTAAEVPSQDPNHKMVLAAITFTLRNTAEKSLWIRTLKAELTAADGHAYEDSAASAIDLDRYYQLFPSLKESSEAPLPPETKLLPGTERRGTIVVSFPIAKEAFDQRKSLVVTIQPYDQPLPITLK